MKAIDRIHFLAFEAISKQIAKDKEKGQIKKTYLARMEEDQEISLKHIEAHGSYYDAFGIWFGGSVGAAIYKRCGYFHAFLSAKPEKLEENKVVDVSVYDIPCKLYFWLAQGFMRGLIIAVDDPEYIHSKAARIMEEKPWRPEPIFDTVKTFIPIILGPRITPTDSEAPIIIHAGVMKGKTLEEAYDKDPNYVQWIAENSRNPLLQTAAKRLMAARCQTV